MAFWRKDIGTEQGANNNPANTSNSHLEGAVQLSYEDRDEAWREPAANNAQRHLLIGNEGLGNNSQSAPPIPATLMADRAIQETVDSFNRHSLPINISPAKPVTPVPVQTLEVTPAKPAVSEPALLATPLPSAHNFKPLPQASVVDGTKVFGKVVAPSPEALKPLTTDYPVVTATTEASPKVALPDMANANRAYSSEALSTDSFYGGNVVRPGAAGLSASHL